MNDTVTLGDNDTEGDFGMNFKFRTPPEEAIAEGFNKHGVRENDDGSIDVRFDAMEPGTRRGIDVTPEFLRSVISHNYSQIPLQLDHSMSQRANVGYIKPSKLEFNDLLQLQAHIPDTGSSVRDDVIADFKHEPPQIQDISASFDPKTVELKKPSSRDENPKFVDARFREFSLTPFPAGYDNGGLTPAFSSAVEKAQISPNEFNEPESQLIKRPHYLIQK